MWFAFLLFLLPLWVHGDEANHKTVYWPSGSGAPYEKITFSETICSCQNMLNLTHNGCLNSTSGEMSPKKCIDKPYWGLVFVWWGVAAFLIGGATTTSLGIISDVWKTVRLHGDNQQKNPAHHQVVDVNWRSDK
jgi:hypothetical protein